MLLRANRALGGQIMHIAKIGISCLALVAGISVGCSSSSSGSNKEPEEGGATGTGNDSGGGTASNDSGGTASNDSGGASDAGTTLCCNKLTDTTTGCTGDAMTNDECTCLPVPAGTPCSEALPDAGPIVSACTGYACCFALTAGGCQCISAGDMSSCYAGMTCAQAASVNGGTMSSSCP
jgi:hypothetical protein